MPYAHDIQVTSIDLQIKLTADKFDLKLFTKKCMLIFSDCKYVSKLKIKCIMIKRDYE